MDILIGLLGAVVVIGGFFLFAGVFLAVDAIEKFLAKLPPGNKKTK